MQRKVSRYSFFIGALIAISSVAPSPCESADRWLRIAPEGTKCSIMMPGKPDHREFKLRTGVRAQSFLVAYKGVSYLFSVCPQGYPPGEQKKALQFTVLGRIRGVQESIDPRKVKLTVRKDYSLKITNGIGVQHTFSFGDQLEFDRQYQTTSHIYSVGVRGKIKQLSAKDPNVKRFFDSFQVHR